MHCCQFPTVTSHHNSGSAPGEKQETLDFWTWCKGGENQLEMFPTTSLRCICHYFSSHTFTSVEVLCLLKPFLLWFKLPTPVSTRHILNQGRPCSSLTAQCQIPLPPWWPLRTWPTQLMIVSPSSQYYTYSSTTHSILLWYFPNFSYSCNTFVIVSTSMNHPGQYSLF